MTEDKRLLILGKKSGGGGGDAVWGSIGGTITDQTDLMTELNNKADTSSIPTVNDSTITFEDSEGTTIDSFTLNQDSNKTITIPSGGGSSKQWFGTEEMFNSIPQNELDPDCDYFISDAIDYRDIVNTPTIPEKVSQLDNDSNFSSENFVRDEIYKCLELIKNREKYITRAEYEALELADKLEEDVNYHIEGDVDTVEMVVTFTDQSTATYEVYIKPNI